MSCTVNHVKFDFDSFIHAHTRNIFEQHRESKRPARHWMVFFQVRISVVGIGSKGHEDTVAWTKETTEQFPGYYIVKLQGVPLFVVSAKLTANKKINEVYSITLTPVVHVSDPLVASPN